MEKIFNDKTTWKSHHLTFIQKLIDTVNSKLSVQNLEIGEVQAAVSQISIDETGSKYDELKNLKNRLMKFLDDKDGAIEYLISNLNDYETRYLAASFLAWFGSDAKIAVPSLIDLVSGHGSAAGAAQRSILHIGGAEQEIIKAIEESASAEDDEIFRNLASLAIKTKLVSSDIFLEFLLKASKHHNPHIREVVADIIWHLKSMDERRISETLELLSGDNEEFVREAAIVSLKLI